MRAVRWVVALVLAGCTSTAPPATDGAPTNKPADGGKQADDDKQADDGKQADPPAKTDPPAKADPPAGDPPPDVDPARWKCDKDEDCTQTCALGAVNREWMTAHPDEDTCDDGCGWKHGMEACRDGECVTLDKDGNIDASCTKRSKPIF